MGIKTKLAVFLSKSAKKAMNILGRKGTHLPGQIANKIDKRIGYNIEKPNKVIAVTGTNGKTTTSNMLSDIISDLGYKYTSNRLGSNTYYGITASLIDANTYFGKNNVEYGVFEVDELWTKKVFDFLTPDTLTITNLFQDSFERNANIYYVLEQIRSSIPKGVKLILNANDSISSFIKTDNEKVYFAVENIFDEKSKHNSNIEDLVYTPDYKEKIIWDFKRYHHIGDYRSSDDSISTPEAKYIVKSIDEEKNELIILDEKNEFKLPIIQKSIENIYNQIAVYATLRENGFSYEQINTCMRKIKVVSSRFDSIEVGNKKIIRMVSKGYNPVANSRVFDTIGKSSQQKTVIYMFDNKESKHIDVRTPGWISSIDFKYLNSKLNKLIFKSRHANEMIIPALLQGIPEEKIVILDEIDNINKYLDRNSEEEIYILHDIESENLVQAYDMKSAIIKYIEGN